jgi:ubiquinone/menaquinone biosynthesis C-methylase UbiE
MGIRRKFFAAVYDSQMQRAERAGLTEMRQALVAQAAGQVLEVGAGTGANLTHYGPGVSSLTVTEPDVSMMKRLERRVRAEAADTVVLRAPAEDLPFEDDTFDVVVSTLVLCGVDDQPRALREIRRVLRPEGRLLFFEHLRSTDPKLARTQDRINWLNQLMVCCDCNRPTLDTISDAGFVITTLDHTSLPKAPPFARPAVMGSATAPTGKSHLAHDRQAPSSADLGANR